MKRFNAIFAEEKPVIAMIHVPALPGTPKYEGNIDDIMEKCLIEAQTYLDCGVDSIMIENMHDTPYLNKNVGPEITANMAIIAREVKNLTKLPCGIQILAGANKEALAVAHAANMDFIRAEGFVFAHVADEGIIESCAGELLRYRKEIGAEDIAIFTDIKKKHSSHSITADVDIVETAKAAKFFMSDGVIITGNATGTTADLKEVEACHKEVKMPVIIGSGVNFENVDKYLKNANGLIIGSYFKKDSYWENNLDREIIIKFMDKVRKIR